MRILYREEVRKRQIQRAGLLPTESIQIENTEG